MVAARRLTHRLAFLALVLVAPSCVDDLAPVTRPSALAEPVARCEVAGPRPALRLPVWDLFVTDANWDRLHADVRADVEVDAQLCIDGELEPIELELQGTSGRLRDKKSFKLKLDRDRELARVGFDDEGGDETIDKVFLRAVWIDQSLVREAVAFDLWREMGHNAPRVGYANLRINGDYWGLYTVVEPVDEDYLPRNGYPTGGQLYKATRKHGSRADFAPGRDLVKAFEDKTDRDDDEDEDEDDDVDEGDDDRPRADLKRLIEKLQKTPLDQAAFEREIDPIFSLDDYIDRMVWVAFTRNGDATSQNYYLYNAPSEGRDRWVQIPWDSDLCMGSNWKDRDVVPSPEVSLMLDGSNFFGRRLTKVPGLRERYVERFREVLDHVLTESIVQGHLERHAARVRQDLEEDQLRWGRHVSPDEAFEVIREFVPARVDALRHGLDTTFGPAGEHTAPVAPAEDDGSSDE